MNRILELVDMLNYLMKEKYLDVKLSVISKFFDKALKSSLVQNIQESAFIKH